MKKSATFTDSNTLLFRQT